MRNKLFTTLSIGILTLISHSAFANNRLYCGDSAAIIVAAELGMSLAEFTRNEDLIWSGVRNENGLIIEEFQFGMGGGLIGITMERAFPKCKQVGEVYTGQDDQD